MKTFVTLSLALLVWLLPASSSSAAVVSWGFSGELSYVYNQSNAVPANIGERTKFAGFISYKTDAAFAGDWNPSSSFGDYYFKTNQTCSITVMIGGATYSTSVPAPGSFLGGINIGDDQGSDYDGLTYWTDGPPLINGAPVPAGITEGSITINLSDYTKTAFVSDAIPTAAPNPANYSGMNMSVSFKAPGAAAAYLYIGGDITEISPLPKVLLTATPLPGNQLRLSWPVSATGLTLQFATSLTSQNWTTEPTVVIDTATEHTVTVSTAGQPKFFRLVKLP